MHAVQKAVPEESLLKTFRGGRRPEHWGQDGDCFSLRIDRPVSLERFVLAFYTSPLFKIERFLLGVLLRSPASDENARSLARGEAKKFAVWYLGERTATQLLMCDRYERTRSWFRVVADADSTELQFGSALAAPRGAQSGETTRGRLGLLLRIHRLYSRMLLRAAAGQLLRD